MTSSYSDLLPELFANVPGAVTVIGSDGETHSSTDLCRLGEIADGLEDPWVDLATDEGFAIGLFMPGDPTVAEPEPSVRLDDGMIYMIKGEPVPGQKTGRHLCSLDLLREPSLLRYPADIDVQTPGSKIEITLSKGNRRDEGPGKWKEASSTFDVFSQSLFDHKAGKKDGPCFLQGNASEGTRKAAAMIANTIIGVDLDSGAPLQDVVDTIVKHGLEAIIYTTHSHLKSTSEIKRDHYLKWSGELVATAEGVRDYLIKVKGVLPEILGDVTIVNDSQPSPEGVIIVIAHKPMPKFRAVFPLDAPFIFAKRGGAQIDAIAEWKERYAGFCTELKLFFDEKCVDPARLFYFPRHPKGSNSHETIRIAGRPVHIEDYDRVKMKRGRDGKRRAVAQNAFTQASGGHDDDEDPDRYVTESGFKLLPWAAKYAKRFEVQTLVEDVIGGDFLRDPRTGNSGIHVECPFEHEHSEGGGNGTFIANASDNYDDGNDGGFVFHCVHNACSGRDRLDFLKGMIDEGLITSEHLTDKAYMIALEDDDEADVPAKSSSAHKSAKSPNKTSANDGSGGEEQADEQEQLEDFGKKYALTKRSGNVFILAEPDDPDEMPEFFNAMNIGLWERERHVFRKDDKGKLKRYPLVKAWLEWEGKRKFKTFGFDPGNTDPKFYNLFQGWPIEPKAGDCSLIKAHILNAICQGDPDHYEWLMTWLAHIFQHPKEKPKVTLVITGKKGTGKSVIFDDLLEALLRNYHFKASGENQISGKFNAEYERILLLLCEEAFWAGDVSKESVLKDLTVADKLRIEPKGVNAYMAKSFLRLVMISNERWVVPATDDERRYAVFECSDRYRGDDAYFTALWAQIESVESQQAFLHELLAFVPKNGWSCVRKAPRTRGLQKQIEETLRGANRFCWHLLKHGFYESDKLASGSIILNDEIETKVDGTELKAAVMDFLENSYASEKKSANIDSIAASVEEWFGAREVRTIRPGRSNRIRKFIFPPLRDARARVKEEKGLDVIPICEDWDEPDDVATGPRLRLV